MSDHELICLCEKEGKDLRPEAITELYREFLKRKLDTSPIASLRIERVMGSLQRAEELRVAREMEFAGAVWKFCFDAKRAGLDNEEIRPGLLQMGLNDHQCEEVFLSMRSEAERMKKYYENEQFTAGLIAIPAIIISIFILLQESFHFLFIPAVYAAVMGIIRYYKGLNEKEKFRIIQEVLLQEKFPAD